MKNIYGLIGAGGYGREVMPVLRSMLRKEIASGNIELVFVVEGESDLVEINGYPIMTLNNFCRLPNPKQFNIAIGDSQVRQRIANICQKSGIIPFSINADNVVIMDANEVGHGVILSPFVTITSNIKIGSYFHANIYSYVAHDCVIGDFVTFAPAVKCNGNVVIEDHAYIGTGAVIKQGSKEHPLIIGKGAIVGMGAVVTRSVQPYTTVVGNPARPLEK